MLRAADKLSSVQFSRRLVFGPTIPVEIGDPATEPVGEIVVRILEELTETNREKGSTLVIVYLPERGDVTHRESDQWRRFLKDNAETHGWHLVDLIDDFRRYPADEIDSLFNGHYSPKGNALVARLLHERRLLIPALTQSLQAPLSATSSAP